MEGEAGSEGDSLKATFLIHDFRIWYSGFKIIEVRIFNLREVEIS